MLRKLHTKGCIFVVLSLSGVPLCDPLDCSMPGFPVLHLLEFAQIHVHWVSDAIQPSHPLSSPSPPAPNPSQHPYIWSKLWFSSSHVWMWESDHKEGWAPKNWYFWTAMSEKTLESPLDSKEIEPINPKGNQSWIFIGKTDAETETPVLCPPDVKSQLIRKDPDTGKDWRQEGKGMNEDKMVGWHHWLNGHEFEQAPGDGEGQESLVCCIPWGCEESDMTEQLNNNNSIS